jgi:signal peptidase I
MRISQIAGTLLGLGVVGGVAFLAATKRFIVEGRSMLPAYAPGDRVLVSRVAYLRSEPLIGDVVIVRQPYSDGRPDIKRIAAAPGAEVEVNGQRVTLGEDEWFVLGDNPDESTDGRQLGPLRRSDIDGKVLFKY